MTSAYKRIQNECLRKNVVGERFGSLVVKKMIYERNGKTMVSCICDCGSELTTYLTYLTSGNTTSCGCIQRKRAGESNTKDFSGMISRNGVRFIRRYQQNDHGCWLWLCSCPCCGNDFVALPAKVLSGHTTSCGCAKMSSRERLIEKFLLDNHIEFTGQYRFADCVDKRELPFDFYLPTYHTCIEYQGQQHYDDTEFYGGMPEFLIRQKHDSIKKEYCNTHNITLLELPYTLSDEEILNTIKNVVNP